jgi:hypothetical protein
LSHAILSETELHPMAWVADTCQSSSSPANLDAAGAAFDPKEPVSGFWVNDRSNLELDLRKSRRASLRWRLPPRLPTEDRDKSRPNRSESCELALPTPSRHTPRQKADTLGHSHWH